MLLSDNKLYDNPLFSDLKVICNNGNKEWYAHKVIICKYSNMLYKKFTVDTKDKTEDIIKVDYDIEVVEHVLKFIYEYDRTFSKVTMEKLIDIYKLGHYWESDILCKYVENIMLNRVGYVSEEEFALLYEVGSLYDNIRKLTYNHASKNFIDKTYWMTLFDVKDLEETLSMVWGVLLIKEGIKILELLNQWYELNKDNVQSDYFEKIKDKYVMIGPPDDHKCEYMSMNRKCKSRKRHGYKYCDGHVMQLQLHGLPLK